MRKGRAAEKYRVWSGSRKKPSEKPLGVGSGGRGGKAETYFGFITSKKVSSIYNPL